ncbi:MAG: PadR family transcriptional regulator [Treponema sp.]|jgi:DNA-binding PadR family transcriptional regulator|nr:PadR family transcriptional regulator [Treponema sp.]
MSLKHGLLALLNHKPSSGWELDKMFHDSLDFFWQAQTSQVYRELNAMEKQGWLSSELVYQTNKPNKKLYTITETGKQELQSWLLSFDDAVEEMFHVRNPLLLHLFFAAGISPEKTKEMLESFRARCRESLRSLETAVENIRKYRGELENTDHADYWRMVMLFGKHRYKASEKWATESLSFLEKKISKEE